jgi:hypothetical protein
MPYNLLDAARNRGNDLQVGLIEENLRFAPELATFMARVIPGTTYETLTVTGSGTVGFSAANDGPALYKRPTFKRKVETFIFRGAAEIDLAVNLASQGYGMPDLEMITASGVTADAMRAIGRQIWYGTAADSLGFQGIKQFTPHTATPGTSNIVVDATGASAGTASSVYAIKFGIQDTHLVFGNNQLLELGEWRDQQLTNATTGGKYAGRVAEMTAYSGLQIGNINCVGRIYNLTTETNKTLNDSLISQLLEKFPIGYVPDALFMSRRSHGQLSRSRNITIFSQAGVNPLSSRTTSPVLATGVSDWNGIPIVVSDSIADNDAINS